MLKRFSISMDDRLLKKFDDFVKKRNYNSRSHAIRDLIRNAIIETEIKEGNKDIFGTITLVYDHEAKGISGKITHLQHGYLSEIRAAIHVHVDKKNCLETLIVHGKANIIKEIAERLEGIKGVKHVKFVMTKPEV
ncbi:MAG: nickel-responsive transcriptional regulator NikR [Thermoplasmata archaeon]|nr:MAG: nickel-responsive transcriptional regulator NikR [Thermoplasmata archaeon]